MIAIRMKKFYKKTGRRVRVDGKTPVGFDKKKLECFNCHNTAGKQEKNQIGLLTMDDGIVNWGEHTEVKETNHALMAIRMKKFYKKTGRRVRVDGKTPVGFDKKKLECF
ncbi:hypothetical protein Tco_0376216, partial [Tanacetum coccineum]